MPYMLEFFTGTKQERAAQETVKRIKSKDRLNARDQVALSTAEKITRRLFLRRMATVAAGTLIVAGSSAGYLIEEFTKVEKPRFSDQQNWLTVESLEIIGKERAKRAIDAARQWDSRYKAGRKVTIVPLDIQEEERLPDGRIVITEETAEPGIIKLGREGDPYNIVLHAMTHATKPDNPTLLSNPLPFSDGIIRGYHGLDILVALRDGKETKFTKIEEGVAERNASAFPGYTVGDARYFAVGNLARSQFPFEKYSYAHEWAKSNDVPALVRARLNLPFGSNITSSHIEAVMTEYTRAWNSGLYK